MSGLLTNRWSGGLASLYDSKGPKGNRGNTGGTSVRALDHQVQVKWAGQPWRPCYTGGLDSARLAYAETLRAVDGAARVRIVNQKGEPV